MSVRRGVLLAYERLGADRALVPELVHEVFARLAHARGLPVEARVLLDPRALEPLEAINYAAADVEELGGAYEALLHAGERRRTGSHYTPRALAAKVVARALDPLVQKGRPLELRVCDPAMGTGVMLLEACRQLAARVGGADATRRVAERCVFGADKSALAVAIARRSLWLLVGDASLPQSFLDHALVEGDALLDLPWEKTFPGAFLAGGFDAVVGNPPWVAYAGRAAQPIEDELFEAYRARYRAFAGYRTLHGLFVERAATLLRPGGRMGLIVPTSVADLAGYAPTRRAHDAHCEVDRELPDFGADAFDGVFQPAMALLSTRRARSIEPCDGAREWTLERSDLDPIARGLLDRCAAMPTLPPHLFGERGYQTTGDDVARLRELDAPKPPFVVALREGSDIAAFTVRAPRLYADPARMNGKLRPDGEWRAVRLLIRQTARFPIVAASDGRAFRNSILAGFAGDGYDEHTLLAWLNSSPVRWLHFMRFRDARQGMPQVKIGHLRATVAPPAPCARDLRAIGERLARRNEGATAEEQARLDALVAGSLGLSTDEAACVDTWRRAYPAP